MSQTRRKAVDTLAEQLRARVASIAPVVAEDAEPLSPETTHDAEARARQHFLGTVEDLTSGQAVVHLPLSTIAPNLTAGQQQPRLLPLPEELADEHRALTYGELLTDLRELGDSLKERQLQPIVVYPGSSERYRDAQYLILVGQRRWTAAHLVGMTHIDAIVVEPPTPLERVRLQYIENEARENFSDIERAWTIAQLRDVLGEASSVTDVAQQLGIQRGRAYQLLRMLALGGEQQTLVATYRMQETQLRPLLDALHQQQVTPAAANDVLRRLAAISTDRRGTPAETQETGTSPASRSNGIDTLTVSRLVARAMAASAPTKAVTPAPRWYQTLRGQLDTTRVQLKRTAERIEQLDNEQQQQLREEMNKLQLQLAAIEQQLDGRP